MWSQASVLLQYCGSSVHTLVYYCSILLSMISEILVLEASWRKIFIMKEKSYFYCQSFFIFTVRYYTLLPRYKIFASYLSGPWSLIFLYFILYSMVVEEQLWSPQSPSFSHPALCTSLTLWLWKCEVFQRWHHWQPSSFSSELSGFDEDITAEEIVDIWKLIQDSLY